MKKFNCGYCGIEVVDYPSNRIGFCSRRCRFLGPPWNKGIKGYSTSRKGMHHSEESKRKISLAKKGIRVSIKTEFKRGSPNSFATMIKGKKYEEFYGNELGKQKKAECSERMIKMWKSSEYKKNQIKSHKDLWKKKEYRETQIPKILKGLMKRPTKLEQKYIQFFKEHKLPFQYCGDGSLLIGCKNPDFVENNGRKICIEVSNKIMRKGKTQEEPEKYEERRIKHFAKCGWECIVLWEEELQDKRCVITKIKNFVQSQIIQV